MTHLLQVRIEDDQWQQIVDPKIVKWLAAELNWPFEFSINGVPECYIEPVAIHYQAKDGKQTTSEWIDAIRAEICMGGSDA